MQMASSPGVGLLLELIFCENIQRSERIGSLGTWTEQHESPTVTFGLLEHAR